GPIDATKERRHRECGDDHGDRLAGKTKLEEANKQKRCNQVELFLNRQRPKMEQDLLAGVPVEIALLAQEQVIGDHAGGIENFLTELPNLRGDYEHLRAHQDADENNQKVWWKNS